MTAYSLCVRLSKGSGGGMGEGVLLLLWASQAVMMLVVMGQAGGRGSCCSSRTRMCSGPCVCRWCVESECSYRQGGASDPGGAYDLVPGWVARQGKGGPWTRPGHASTSSTAPPPSHVALACPRQSCFVLGFKGGKAELWGIGEDVDGPLLLGQIVLARPGPGLCKASISTPIDAAPTHTQPLHTYLPTGALGLSCPARRGLLLPTDLSFSGPPTSVPAPTPPSHDGGPTRL